ncbi:MAG TPA: GNAT family N-acetyltransferase, partial [Gammaproteobacteria bacterium]|nr:GNAT family N-acetyltransferase [Gammaproteobacteria bacterium]
HPDYRGKGLFTRLAERTYEAAAERGFHSVYGVANANSTPGFVRKLGFQLVEPLQARIGIGSLGIHLASAARDAQFQRVWTQDSLGWRCANPANAVRYTQMSDGLGLFAAAYGRILSAYAELPLNAPVPTHAVANRAPSQFRLYLGLAPSSACRPSAYVPIPDRLRPSPLNLIFRPLTQRGSRLEAGHVNFSFLDFDAY